MLGMLTTIPLYEHDLDRANSTADEGDIAYSRDSGYGWYDGTAWRTFDTSEVITRTVEYAYNKTTSPPPGNGQIRFDTPDPAQATTAWLSMMTAPGTDVTAALSALTPAAVWIQEKADAGVYVRFTVNGAPVVNAGWVQYAVTLSEAGGALTQQNAPVLVMLGMARA